MREYEAGESDKRLLLLCKGHGRIMVYARGARKAKSKFLAASQMFTYGDYVLVDGRQFYSISQAEVIEAFYPIRQDYTRLSYAQYIFEICEKALPDRSPCDELLRLVLKTLQHISGQKESGQKDNHSGASCKQALSVFLFRFFLFNGLAPETGCCCSCGADDDRPALFCDEGVLCQSCAVTDTVTDKIRMPLSPAAIDAISHIIAAEMPQAFMFRVQETVLEEIYKAAQLCWLGHFQIRLHTAIVD